MDSGGTVARGNDLGTEARRRPDEPRSFSPLQRLSLWAISWAGYLLVRAVGCTLRFLVTAEEGSLSDGVSGLPGIYCFWHRSVLPATYRFRGLQIAVMISRSFDGESIARIIRKLGFRPVRGSSSRHGAAALLGMRKELEQGHPVAFTIDGPRGPMYVAKPGPVMLAKKTGHKIVCFHIAVERAWIVNSWDKMMVPKPFSRAAIHLSSPLSVPPDATEKEMETFHQRMQLMLDRCRHEAEARLA